MIFCDPTVARNHELRTTEKRWTLHRATRPSLSPLYWGDPCRLFGHYCCDVIIVTSDWNNRFGHPGLPAIMQQCILYLGASQWACDVTLSRESSNDCFWLVNTAKDGRLALPVCSDTATPVATSRQILNRSNVLWHNCDWPESSCKVAQTGQLDSRVASQVVLSLCPSPA